MTLAAGTRLGPYEILAPLGAGGMGEVYRARDTKLDRDVAVKVLPPSLAGDPAALARFEREAKVVAALSHPNILAVHDFGSSGETTYAVMELLDGESLRQRLADGALPVRKAAEIAREIALGLSGAHDKGIVHRDLKPENLFLTKDGRVKILDFGLARHIALPSSGDTHSPTAAPGTEPGTVLGTVGYMAPEQLRGQPADHRSDIFSFGAVLYEMLSGRRAFLGETAIETMNAILKEDPPEISQAASGRQIPPGLGRIVSHCLEKKPDERFQSARDLAFDLGSLSTATSASASGATSAMPAPSQWKRRAMFSTVGILGLALAFWAGARLSSRGPIGEVRLKRLTFRRGNILTARFAPDGQTVVYGAAWEGRPAELFTVRTDSGESRPLGIDHANLLSMSPNGDLAVVLHEGSFQALYTEGTLARLPLGGGAPRELEENVFGAAWAPDGKNLAVVRRAPSGKGVLEYPVGHAIEESFDLRGMLAMSPRGELAFVESDSDGALAIWIAEAGGRKRPLVRGLVGRVEGLGWSRRAGDLLFVGGRRTDNMALRAVSPSGRERLVWPLGNGYALHDVAPDGRVLLERAIVRGGVIWMSAAGDSERDLAWLDGTLLGDLALDGSQILFSEASERDVSKGGGVYVRRTDGSPAVRLGDGDPMSLSPDGKWALALVAGQTPPIVLLPTGPGSPRPVPIEGITPLSARFLGDGRIAVFHSGSDGQTLLSIVGPEGGRAKPIPLTGMDAFAGVAFSPDVTRAAYVGAARRVTIVPLAGGPSQPVPNAAIADCEHLSQWSRDGRYLTVQKLCEVPSRLDRIDVGTGERTLWRDLAPNDRAGVVQIGTIRTTADGSGYAYGYARIIASDLYVVDGLK
jgi:eukaryotic-like serine/threonine-protein kinase